MTLSRRTPLERGGPLLRRVPLVSRSRLPRESVKRRRSAPTRRRLVKDILAAYPVCCRCQERPSTTLHEPLKRSRRPGSHLDERLVVPSCDECNEFAEREHDLATAEDWLIPSTTPYADAVRITAKWLMRGAA